MKLDILAFGVHPDDVELGCAGTLLVEKLHGKKTGIIDMTRGELGTRGTAQTRKAEAAESKKILGVAVRENLGMADGFFRNDEEHQMKVIRVLRKYRPEIVLCNSPRDRHPDHGRAAQLVKEASFLAGLRKVKTKEGKSFQEEWRPAYVFHYIQDYYIEPAFLIDISEVIEQKTEAIRAYKTQFFTASYSSDEPQTYISTPGFLDSIISRSATLGKMIGVAHAEGYLTTKMIGFGSFDNLIAKRT